MITPLPKMAEPVVAFEPANRFYGDHLSISDEEEWAGPMYCPEPFVLIGYDGQAWRVHETFGPPIPNRTLFSKIVAWIIEAKPTPSLVAREVKPVQFSLDEFKGEVCRRIPGNPNAVFGDETLVGEGLPPGVDIERIGAQLVEKLCANVRAAASITEVIDALLEAQSDGYEWAEGFARA